MTKIQALFCWLSTGMGTGYFPAPGTAATVLLGMPLLLVLKMFFPREITYVGVVVLLTCVATWCIHQALPLWVDIDPQEIVLDEIVGLLWIGVGLFMTPWSLVTGVLLFRLLDIFKPWPIYLFEYLPGAVGVVADDVVAALVARLLMWLLWR